MYRSDKAPFNCKSFPDIILQFKYTFGLRAVFKKSVCLQVKNGCKTLYNGMRHCNTQIGFLPGSKEIFFSLPVRYA